MKEVHARLISSTIKKGKTIRAQVVVLMEGPNRRSVTSHVEHKGDVWVGRNPDDSTESRHAAADRAVSEAQARLSEFRESEVTTYFAEDVKNAEKHKEDVEREYPLYVQFKF